jgi:hypothetical protein
MITDKSYSLLSYSEKELAELVLSRISVFALCREQNARIEQKNDQYSIVLDSSANKYSLTLDRMRIVAYLSEIKWRADKGN